MIRSLQNVICHVNLRRSSCWAVRSHLTCVVPRLKDVPGNINVLQGVPEVEHDSGVQRMSDEDGCEGVQNTMDG